LPTVMTCSRGTMLASSEIDFFDKLVLEVVGTYSSWLTPDTLGWS